MRTNPLFATIAATALAFGIAIGAAATATPEQPTQGAIVRTVASVGSLDAQAAPGIPHPATAATTATDTAL